MKTLFNKLFIIGVLALLLNACKKDETQAMLSATVSSSALAVNPNTAIVLDSTKNSTTAVTFTWGATNFGFSAAVTYTLQFDTTAAGSFSKTTDVVLGQNLVIQAYTVKDFNTLAIQTLGLSAAAAHKINVRLKSDVNQNNGSVSSIASVYSAGVSVTVTPYSVKPVPVIPAPANLYLVGDASAGGWNNPVPVPSQQFTPIDAYGYVFGLITQLSSTGSYLFLPVNGDWSHKYGGSSATGGSLLVDGGVPGSNTPAPSASGLYYIVVDFVKGSYTVTAVTSNPTPANLYIVGDATAGGWANPVPTPSQQFTHVSSADYRITVPLVSTGTYLFLPLNGDWGHKYGGASATGGALLSDGSVPGSNTPGPAVSGNYLIDVNFLTKQYTVTKQ